MFCVMTNVGHEILAEKFGLNSRFFARVQDNIIRQKQEIRFNI